MRICQGLCLSILKVSIHTNARDPHIMCCQIITPFTYKRGSWSHLTFQRSMRSILVLSLFSYCYRAIAVHHNIFYKCCDANIKAKAQAGNALQIVHPPYFSISENNHAISTNLHILYQVWIVAMEINNIVISWHSLAQYKLQ